MIEIEQGTGKYVTIAADEETALRWSGAVSYTHLDVYKRQIRDLLRSALRMRPDRIILGEVRDAAACELLTAMNTGHDGSLSTGHANSPQDMLNRLETLVLMGMDIPLEAVRSQIASCLLYTSRCV